MNMDKDSDEYKEYIRKIVDKWKHVLESDNQRNSKAMLIEPFSPWEKLVDETVEESIQLSLSALQRETMIIR